MDTHIHPDPGDTQSRPLHVSLPEDLLDRERVRPDGDTVNAPKVPSSSPQERLSAAERQLPRRRRGLFLGTAACVMVLGVGAAYLLSPYNTAYPVPRMASTLRHLAEEAGIGRPAVLAPSAHLARVNAPPLPPPAPRASYAAVPRKSAVDEILALRSGGSGAIPAPDPTQPSRFAAQASGAAPTLLPGEPGGPQISSNPAIVTAPHPITPASAPDMGTPTPTPDLTTLIVAGLREHDVPQQAASAGAKAASDAAQKAAPVPSTEASKRALEMPASPQSPTASAPATPPAADAATTAARLQAAPMSTAEQVQVLELVTRLGTLVADQRKEVDQLRADLARSRTDDIARIDDFQRRLTLDEAERALAKASVASADWTLAPTSLAVPASEQRPSGVRATLVVARAAMAADPTAHPAQRYRVQAASPGLAMLAAIDRAGDGSAQLQVALGDTVPGYGRVKSIVQQGATWVVKTERGTIGQ